MTTPSQRPAYLSQTSPPAIAYHLQKLSSASYSVLLLLINWDFPFPSTASMATGPSWVLYSTLTTSAQSYFLRSAGSPPDLFASAGSSCGSRKRYPTYAGCFRFDVGQTDSLCGCKWSACLFWKTGWQPSLAGGEWFCGWVPSTR